ncbi:esterase-like activity of phytase family protein [Zunongwangia sp. F363]|uniref:Esterase-like activity of phytase family protein n=1 Tax=Autumnicola tepida TaxID=3075595 RepID=A0ABU3CC36_9FLAO|nr:esterase-like activity of phytase family protein [Zunongwangia sp. F363]MDT0643889.1 esterase-like activity of phytase family protein [Zunongwangia sp. F363]
MKKIFPIVALLLLCSCATTNKIKNDIAELNYLDDFVLPGNLEVDNTKVGGLSGIDYSEGKYYLICDQPSTPRYYIADIKLKENSIDTVTINKVVKLDQSAELKNVYLDPESIRHLPQEDAVLISSEGQIDKGKDPGIFKISEDGKFLETYPLPDYFLASGEQKPRNNGVFEGLSLSYDGSGYWTSTELPLEKDGPKPKLFPTKSPVRITLFNSEENKAIKQFAYKLDGISKIPFLYFAVNGVTEILEYKNDKFLVLERAYSSGHGSNGNTVKIFAANAANATNTLKIPQLRTADYRFTEKELLFDFKTIKDKLEEGIIDNIEGMAFGPKLANGNQSLILISDNNFNSIGTQISQIILLELKFLQ